MTFPSKNDPFQTPLLESKTAFAALECRLTPSRFTEPHLVGTGGKNGLDPHGSEISRLAPP